MEAGDYRFGATLIEILIVVAVIIILAAMVVGVGVGIDNQTKAKALKNTFSTLEGALHEYYDFADRFPPATEVDPHVNCEIMYAALDSVPACREVLERLDRRVVANKFNPAAVPPVFEVYDPWGTVLDYRYNPGDSFPKLISAGPDRDMAVVGDNITNK